MMPTFMATPVAENAAKLTVYQRALENWKLNDAHYREMGLPCPPEPEPPQLASIEPLPPGWWFQNHAATGVES